MAKITSIEQFKNGAIKDIEIPGYEPGEVFVVKVRKVSLLGLAASGKIPNSLMGTVTKLFNTPQVGTESVSSNVVEMTKLMDLIAKNSLVEPSYEEVKDYLTDDQLGSIFENAMAGIKQVTPINGK